MAAAFYPRAQHLGRMDFSPVAVLNDFQRLAGKLLPFLTEFSEGDRVRIRQELAAVELVVDGLAGRQQVRRAAAVAPAARLHPLFPDPIPYTPPSFADSPRWQLRKRGAGSRKAVAT